MSTDSPIFVVGAPRSGTTLLQRMLRSHPRISSPTGESHFIVLLLANAASFGDLTQRQNVLAVLREMHRCSTEFMETDLHGTTFDLEALADAILKRNVKTMPQVIDALFRINAEGEGKARWLDKTPYYIHHIPLLAAVYPDAQFVHIIRDGRDAVLSMLERSADIRVFSVFQGAKLWKSFVDAGRAIGAVLPKGRYLEFRYEDLLVDQEATVRRLCEFLGEPFSDQVINFQKSSDPHTKTPLLKGELKTDNREKWRDRMTPRQVATFEAVAADTLVNCGYPTAGQLGKTGFSERVFWRLHDRLMQRLHPHPSRHRMRSADAS